MPDSCAEKNSSAFRTSLQIGFGIGDGLKMLAKEFPTVQLIGLDLTNVGCDGCCLATALSI